MTMLRDVIVGTGDNAVELSLFPWEDADLTAADLAAMFDEADHMAGLDWPPDDLTLTAIFAEANARRAEQLSLRFDIWYKSDVIHLSGYRIGDDQWTRITEQEDRIPTTYEVAAAEMDAAGWAMPTRPVKQGGLAFIWQLKPVAALAGGYAYGTKAADAERVERAAFNRQWAPSFGR